MWVNAQGDLYTGDKAAGDRAATAEEIAAWEAERAPKPADISAAEMQAQRERQIENTIEKLGAGTTTARLAVIEEGIRLLLKG